MRPQKTSRASDNQGLFETLRYVAGEIERFERAGPRDTVALRVDLAGPSLESRHIRLLRSYRTPQSIDHRAWFIAANDPGELMQSWFF
jgi:hypothetical protein